EQYLGRLGCCGGNCDGEARREGPGAGSQEAQTPDVRLLTPDSQLLTSEASLADAARDFFRRALAEQLSPADVFRITITSFLDAYNFDVRRLMKCCTHHVLPSGHVIPFCAYNVLYREGHVPLPTLRNVQTAPRTHTLPLVAETPAAAAASEEVVA